MHMPVEYSKSKRIERDKLIIDRWTAGVRQIDIAKEFNLSDVAIQKIIYHKNNAKYLEESTKKAVCVHRRISSLGSNIVARRLEAVSSIEADNLKINEVETISTVVDKFAKLANLAEGLPTERNEGGSTINVICPNPETAKALANGITGGAIQL